MKLHGLVPSFCIHLSVSDLYIPTIGPPILPYWVCGLIIGLYNRSQIHEYGNWERVRAVSFLGIFVLNFRYSAFAVQTVLYTEETCSTFTHIQEHNSPNIYLRPNNTASIN